MAEEDTEENPFVPALIDKTIPLEAPLALTHDATINQAKEADVHYTNQMLGILHHVLPQAKSIAGLTRLITTVNQTLEMRRKLLNLQYGAPKDTNTRPGTLTPLE